MVSHNETKILSKERYFSVDLIRLLSMVAIAHFHLHEATFYTNEHHTSHAFFEWPLEPFSRFMAFSGFTIVFLSYFLIGLKGLTAKKMKQLLIVAFIGTLLIVGVFFDGEVLLLEWDIYPFIATASLLIFLLSRIPYALFVGSIGSVIMIALPPQTWVFPQWQNQWFYGPLFGNYHLVGEGSWPLIPWMGLPILAFSLGRFLRRHPEKQDTLKSIGRIEILFWGLALVASSFYWGAFYHVQVGSDFYKFVQNVPRIPWLAHMIFVFLSIRLGFVQPINLWAQKTPSVAWISKLYLNQRFFFFYIVNWFLIGLFSNFENFYMDYWPIFDLVVFGLFPLTEFLCHCLTKGYREVLGQFKTPLRGAP